MYSSHKHVYCTDTITYSGGVGIIKVKLCHIIHYEGVYIISLELNSHGHHIYIQRESTIGEELDCQWE